MRNYIELQLIFRSEINYVLKRTYDLRTIEADNPQQQASAEIFRYFEKSVVFLFSDLWFERTRSALKTRNP